MIGAKNKWRHRTHLKAASKDFPRVGCEVASIAFSKPRTVDFACNTHGPHIQIEASSRTAHQSVRQCSRGLRSVSLAVPSVLTGPVLKSHSVLPAVVRSTQRAAADGTAAQTRHCACAARALASQGFADT